MSLRIINSVNLRANCAIPNHKRIKNFKIMRKQKDQEKTESPASYEAQTM